MGELIQSTCSGCLLGLSTSALLCVFKENWSVYFSGEQGEQSLSRTLVAAFSDIIDGEVSRSLVHTTCFENKQNPTVLKGCFVILE